MVLSKSTVDEQVHSLCLRELNSEDNIDKVQVKTVELKFLEKCQWIYKIPSKTTIQTTVSQKAITCLKYGIKCLKCGTNVSKICRGIHVLCHIQKELGISNFKICLLCRKKGAKLFVFKYRSNKHTFKISTRLEWM